jgi:hypothetical protein
MNAKKIIHITLACFLSLAFAGCSGSSNYPVVVADEEHLINLGSQKDTPAYEIEPAGGVRLDIGQFKFIVGGATVTPDTVQVWDVAPTRYRLHLAQPITNNVIVLDANTLSNVVSGGPAFQGFRPGHRLMVNVGRLSPLDVEPDHMTYDWEGLIIVNSVN